MLKKLSLKYGGEWIFLTSAILLYLLILPFKSEIIWQSLVEFKNICWQILPIFILVFVLIFLASLFLSEKKALKYLKTQNKFAKYLTAIIFGILSSGPIYMWYPLLADLKEKGIKNDVLAVFLYNRAVKIPLMPMIVYYFGWPFLIIMSALMIIFSILNGALINKLTK